MKIVLTGKELAQVLAEYASRLNPSKQPGTAHVALYAVPEGTDPAHPVKVYGTFFAEVEIIEQAQ